MPSKRRKAIPLAYGAVRIGEPGKDKRAFLLLKPQYLNFSPEFDRTEVSEISPMHISNESRRTWQVTRSWAFGFYNEKPDIANKFDLFIYTDERVFLQIRGEQMREKHLKPATEKG